MRKFLEAGMIDMFDSLALLYFVVLCLTPRPAEGAENGCEFPPYNSFDMTQDISRLRTPTLQTVADLQYYDSVSASHLHRFIVECFKVFTVKMLTRVTHGFWENAVGNELNFAGIVGGVSGCSYNVHHLHPAAAYGDVPTVAASLAHSVGRVSRRQLPIPFGAS
ncbi:hypothetical protein FB45DRAFT_1022694 [Roridomyces roridus]|uniref:Uncharacterized protein n=1 Tax=Roridomyces roridus TaxID=1738132 RepID=A0AAD7C8L5_9AGAR|nr:hypothetical protein FB45DRAFT_1022694 [Roridomyces roridus]